MTVRHRHLDSEMPAALDRLRDDKRAVEIDVLPPRSCRLWFERLLKVGTSFAGASDSFHTAASRSRSPDQTDSSGALPDFNLMQ